MAESTPRYTSSPQDSLITMQISYSTADVERSIFNGSESDVIYFDDQGSGDNVNLLVVDGDVYVLQEASPQQSIPLSPEAGIHKIIGIDQHE